ncbi:spermidine synthase [Pseudonocardia abyssalis]|uniref:spermidine synthase n=1 Tax=Pseudonocardia abyssalis TaxID=2792008 RepID=UPI001CF665BF|nr:spermidine synthase [Pseudonocardia abyssalis]
MSAPVPGRSGRRSARRGTGAGPGARLLVLDRADTAIGEISLRRRHDPVADVEVFEAKLDDEFLMSSLFTVAEIELARRGLAAVEGDALDVVVGGLGLGYTAVTVLDDPRVRSVTVVEALPEVIGWHRNGLLPVSERLTGDPRVVLRCADFFAQVAGGDGLDPEAPGGRYDAVLVDIDHAPDHVLAPAHAEFYAAAGLRRLLPSLREGGVLGLWSDRPPLDVFGAVLGEVFSAERAEVVDFPNPLTGGRSSNTLYLARR